MYHGAATIFVLAFLVDLIAYAGTPSKIITAVRTEHPPVLDGLITEAQWQTAPAALDFTQFDPIEGGLPTEMTSVRMLYDDHALYIGVICYDSNPAEGIVHQLIRRDRTSEADRFTVQIDSYHDLQTAFVFSANVSGVQSDGVLSQDGIVYDLTWDAVWRVKMGVYLDGWSAEFAIPYSALRFSALEDEEYVWGINFRRYISRKGEIDEWVMVPRSERAQISKWGLVNGIREIKPPLQSSLFGDRDVDEFDVALRGIVTFTRVLSLQFYSQVLLARGKYDNYSRLVGSTQLLPTTGPTSNYDFNLIRFNANVLLRWEFLPGSTVYLVWTQARFENTGDYSLGFGRRFKNTFSLPHEDVLLLRVSYWLPL